MYKKANYKETHLTRALSLSYLLRTKRDQDSHVHVVQLKFFDHVVGAANFSCIGI